MGFLHWFALCDGAALDSSTYLVLNTVEDTGDSYFISKLSAILFFLSIHLSVCLSGSLGILFSQDFVHKLSSFLPCNAALWTG